MLLTKGPNHHLGIIALKDLDFFDVFAVKFNFKNANWLRLETVHRHGGCNAVDLIEPRRVSPEVTVGLLVAVLRLVLRHLPAVEVNRRVVTGLVALGLVVGVHVRLVVSALATAAEGTVHETGLALVDGSVLHLGVAVGLWVLGLLIALNSTVVLEQQCCWNHGLLVSVWLVEATLRCLDLVLVQVGVLWGACVVRVVAVVCQGIVGCGGLVLESLPCSEVAFLVRVLFLFLGAFLSLLMWVVLELHTVHRVFIAYTGFGGACGSQSGSHSCGGLPLRSLVNWLGVAV